RQARAAADLRVQRRLLVGRREGPRRGGPPLLAEGEAQLARRLQAVRSGRTEGAAGPVAVQRAEEVLAEEAVVARHLACRAPSLRRRHPSPSCTVRGSSERRASNQVVQRGSRPAWGSLSQIPASLLVCPKSLQTMHSRPRATGT